MAVLLLLPLAIYLFVCLWTYHPGDPGWSHAGDAGPVRNTGGTIGAWIADIGFYFIGVSAYLMPMLLLFTSWRMARPEPADAIQIEPPFRLVGGVALVACSSALSQIHFASRDSELPANAGGVFGQLLGRALEAGFGELGATLFLLALLLVAITLTTGISWFRVMDRVGQVALALGAALLQFLKGAGEWRRARGLRVE